MDSARPKMGKRIAVVLNIALLLLAVWVFLNRQFVLDQIALFNYRPPAEIAAIARDTTMTDESKRYFYASHPVISDRADFNVQCASHDEQTAVLGCYNGKNIYLFNVTDPQLEGIKQVTAAHEMLHAAYQRLSPGERKTLDASLEIALKNINSERLQKMIDYYNKVEPGELLNEMHSILGTEVAKLDPALEDHYRRYFDDRQKIVNYAAAYEKVFDTLQDQQQSLLQELKITAETINSATSAYNAAVGQLNADIESFKAEQASGALSEDEQRAQIDALQTRQESLQRERERINQLTTDFNNKRSQLLTLNSEAEKLNSSINSQLPTVEGVQ